MTLNETEMCRSRDTRANNMRANLRRNCAACCVHTPVHCTLIHTYDKESAGEAEPPSSTKLDANDLPRSLSVIECGRAAYMLIPYKYVVTESLLLAAWQPGPYAAAAADDAILWHLYRFRSRTAVQ